MRGGPFALYCQREMRRALTFVHAPVHLALAALVVALGALWYATSRAPKPRINSYAPTAPCQKASPRDQLSAVARDRDYATRDLSGPPMFGICNVPTRPLDWIVAKPLRFDGQTEISVEFFLAAAEPEINSAVVGYLFDGSRNLGAFTNTQTMNLQGGARNATSQYARLYFTPTAGVHRFKIVLAAVGGTSNPVYSGHNLLGSDPHHWPWWEAVRDWQPSYLRIEPA